MVTRRAKRLHADERAVAMAEFIVVFVPVILVFLATIELSRLAIAELMLERAAGVAVRACAVIKDQPLNCDTNGPDAQNRTEQDRLILLAATLAVEPMRALAIRKADCNTGTYTGTDVVDVQADFYCAVPLVRGFLCSPAAAGQAVDPTQSSLRALTASAKYGHQGARYNCDFSNPRWMNPFP